MSDYPEPDPLPPPLPIFNPINWPQVEGTGGGGGGGAGFQGLQGVTGPFGSPPGPQGFQGIAGIQGAQGYQGDLGLQGVQGFDAVGLQGYQGTQGTEGFQGSQGYQGFDAVGLQGYQGHQGVEGLQGYQGVQGIHGLQGFQGIEGLQGFQGNDGLNGVQGNLGLQGYQGAGGAGTFVWNWYAYSNVLTSTGIFYTDNPIASSTSMSITRYTLNGLLQGDTNSSFVLRVLAVGTSLSDMYTVTGSGPGTPYNVPFQIVITIGSNPPTGNITYLNTVYQLGGEWNAAAPPANNCKYGSISVGPTIPYNGSPTTSSLQVGFDLVSLSSQAYLLSSLKEVF
jgi:hypothetical protein